jgi:hypothetical protein
MEYVPNLILLYLSYDKRKICAVNFVVLHCTINCIINSTFKNVIATIGIRHRTVNHYQLLLILNYLNPNYLLWIVDHLTKMQFTRTSVLNFLTKIVLRVRSSKKQSKNNASVTPFQNAYMYKKIDVCSSTDYSDYYRLIQSSDLLSS